MNFGTLILIHHDCRQVSVSNKLLMVIYCEVRSLLFYKSHKNISYLALRRKNEGKTNTLRIIKNEKVKMDTQFMQGYPLDRE